MRNLLVLIILFVAQIASVDAARWTASDLRLMPPYCAGRFAREENNMVEYKRWEAKYGPSFLHTHHLCHGIGLIEISYHKARSPQEKRGVLDEAMGHLGYMLQHSSPDFALLPDVHYYRGRGFIYQNKEADAIAAFLKAIELNPKYTVAYTSIADLYVKMGSKDRALKIVTEGLTHLPESKSLKRLYERLGGKLPFPEPVGDAGTGMNPGQSWQTHDVRETEKANDDKRESNEQSERNSVVYAFSRVGHGGMQHGYNAGNYVFLEVTEDTKAPTEYVVFKITTQIPEPHSRIQSIAFGMGRHVHMFLGLEPDQLLGRFYPVTRYTTPYTHPFWPGFKAHYLLEFSMDLKIRKPNDARRLAPGNSLVIKAKLAPGVSYADVLRALKAGERQEDGLVVAIIPHHLKGPPLPRGTRSDDGGYFTGRVVTMSGVIVKEIYGVPASDTSPANSNPKAAVSNDSAENKNSDPGASSVTPKATSLPPKPNARNPWCRFCPEEN
jgi:tetratricopeptide (TPR) repeat protein